ncbi:MAG: hypothetical protein AAGA66_14685 [Bacteroidota bacterium]
MKRYHKFWIISSFFQLPSLVVKLVGSALLLFTCGTSWSQLLSPNASSAANVGAAQTGPYTGKPDISIPVASISGRDISIPVSLSYNASGVRVEDVGSWAGLSWNLNVGGVITREIRGRSDFGGEGYFRATTSLPPREILDDCSSEGLDYENYVTEVINGQRDAEPDLYNLSFPGFSAQFFFDQAGNPYTIPRQKIKIQKPATQNGEWVVTTLDGYTYTFGGQFIESNPVTAWYLKEIRSPFGETATFHYVRHRVYYKLLPSEFRLFATGGTCTAEDQDTNSSRDVDIYSQFLERVTIGNSTLTFHLVDRCDIMGKRLDRIEVKESEALVSAFHFDFFCDEEKQRLWLLAVRSAGKDGKTLPPYRFDYHDKEALPGIRSYAQDHWGFYNGRSGNTRLTPSYLTQGFSFSGANRNPHPVHVLKGTLERVTYPMGGTTDYTFEINDYANYTDQYPELVQVPYRYRAADGYGAQGSDARSVNFQLLNDATVNFDFVVHRVRVIEQDEGGGPTTGGDDTPIGDHFVRLLKGTEVIETWGETGNDVRFLEAGTYTLVAEIDDNDPEKFTSRITASFQGLTREASSPSSRYGGGVRVNKIVTNDGMNQSEEIVQTFDYSDFGTGQTSGKLMSGPVYHYKARTYCNATDYVDQLAFFSSSTIPLSSAAAGSYVGYSNVTVYYTEGEGEGRSRYSYFNEAEAFTTSESRFNFGDRVPFTPTSGDWYKNGLMEYSEDYRYFNGQFYLQSRQAPTYAFAEVQEARGLVVVDGGIYENKCLDLFYGFYGLKTAWIQQPTVEATAYDGDAGAVGTAITTSTENAYDPVDPWMMTAQYVYGSEGETYLTEYKYPKHFDDALFGGAIGGMKEKYLLNVPVQTLSKKRVAGSNTTYVLGSSLTSFHPVADTYLPNASYSLEIPSPVTDYAFSASNPLHDSRMKPQIAYTYDAVGNLIQTAREELVSSSIYGYEDDWVMARVSNAQANEIAYTGFETSGQGGWSYQQAQVIANGAYAGTQAFTQGALQLDGLPDQSYIVELWAKGSGAVAVNTVSKSVVNGWGYLSWQVSGTSVSVEVPAGTMVDEVRLYPSDALMTSYTYDPAAGVTASVGSNGKAVFTEYDAFNRAVTQKDFKKQVRSVTDHRLRGNLHGFITHPAAVDIYSAAAFSISLGEDLPQGITCTWDFGDGSVPQEGLTVHHTFTKIGHRLVKATLSSAGYATKVEQKSIFVGGELSGEIAHTPANFDQVVTFTLPGSEENPPGTTYTWTYNGIEIGTGSSASYAFNRLGHQKVAVTMDHPDFPERIVDEYLEVIPLGVLEGTITHTTAVLGQPFNLSVTGNAGRNPAGTEYNWSLDQAVKTGSSVTHRYDRLGIMTVSMTMSARGYHPRRLEANIRVAGDMRADWSGPNPSKTLIEDESGIFYATQREINPPDAEYTWQFTQPDGTILTRSGSSISQAFTQPGTVSVKLTVTDSDYELEESTTRSLQINYGSPILTTSTPPEANPRITLTVDNAQLPFSYFITEIGGDGSYSRRNVNARSVSFDTNFTGPTTVLMKVIDASGREAEVQKSFPAGPFGEGEGGGPTTGN